MRNRKAQAHGALWKKYGYDIKISVHGMDGMKTAQLFRKKVSAKILIFVSSSREYVFEAYDVEAFQYLLKPVEDRKLKSVLQKAVLKTERRSQEFIIVSSQRQKKKLFLDDKRKDRRRSWAGRYFYLL